MDGRRPPALLCALLLSVASASIFDNTRSNKCQPIEISLCKDIPYNDTFYPNLLGHTDQHSLNMQTDHFKPLIRTKCSPHIKFFICSVFAPMCPEAFPQAVTSCREVCLQVMRDCLSLLNEFGIGWPEPLNCSKFPQAPELCMKPTDTQDSWASNAPTVGSGHVDPLKEPHIDVFPSNPVVKCPDDMIDLDPTDPMGACGVPCTNDIMFHEQNKRFAELWMLIWASICLVVTAFTVLTFLLDRSRFRFPERSIFYLAACYHLYSWVYIVRVFFLSYDDSGCERLRSGTTYLTAGGLDNPKCVLMFMVNYYFSLASSLWWVILTFTWYLSAGRKWVPEGIEAWSSYFHFVAWGVPALLSIAVLITHKVDASELTGICFVGNSDPLALWGFVVGPRIFFVLIGGCFLIAGFASICTVRDSLRNQGTDTSKLEKLMVKIGIFSVLYIIPAVLIIACDSYHALLLREWQPATTACKARGGIDNIVCSRPKTKPQVEVYMLNIFMSLIVGTTAGMWVGSRKTCATWQKILCCGLLSPPGTKHPSGSYSGAACKPLMAPGTAALTASRTSGQTQGTVPSYQMTMLPPPHPHTHSVSSYSSGRRKYQPWIQPTTTASSETSKVI